MERLLQVFTENAYDPLLPPHPPSSEGEWMNVCTNFCNMMHGMASSM